MSEFKIKFPLKIVNIHRGQGYRSQFIYAALLDDDDHLLISATLPYIMDRIPMILGDPDAPNRECCVCGYRWDGEEPACPSCGK